MQVALHKYIIKGDKVEVTVRCPECDDDHTVVADKVSYEAWRGGQGSRLIQKLMPELTPAQREILMTGICEGCWNELFPPEEE